MTLPDGQPEVPDGLSEVVVRRLTAWDAARTDRPDLLTANYAVPGRGREVSDNHIQAFWLLRE